MTRLVTRQASPADAEALARHGLHPVLARLYAARGVTCPEDIETALARLVPPASLKGCEDAAVLLADALAARKRMLVVADYDCDGATACAVAVRGLRMLGASIDYLVPNRFEYGYGLTPEIVKLAAARRPELLITVDNGIASVDGVAAANALGIDVLVTDHHLPGATLPAARAIVNPNQPGCEFPSKHIAGVGVMFYVLLALRAELRRRGAFDDTRPEPRLDGLLDLVALGTVADVVRLDGNNRVLVAQGLQRIRKGRMQPGIAALFRAAAREARSASAFDLGFGLGPRLNAAGRLSDMSLGIECLTTDDIGRAWELAQQLDTMNRERREIEAGMQQQALADLAQVDPAEAATITLFNPDWHQGVIGIVAGRLKEKFHRPSFTFAHADESGARVKGSGRSIPGFHLRDALDLVSKREPDLLVTFGGHAMAAGVTLETDKVPRFAAAFEAVAREWLSEEALSRVLETDGDLEDAYFTPQFVELLDGAVWGQGFPAPLFSGEFEVASQALVKDKHLKLQLARGRQRFGAIWFNHTEPLPAHATVAYRLASDTWNGVTRVQLIVEHAA
ncbi:single-stranded-DNA-specific exonuclease RecJ [Burkholderia gladioli]|jgi:single-stranded-DNA-specific exonuclease|uniref:single-stranded-DNA-specific exonuclease RecJ n=1 Tax=Burkholderia gladioli TaxID=28095 RepID=UPI000F805378|nr:single-stranded-DNA-specific exonuclease RecJ [Burkholderia gladioli]KAF1062510.1 Single-stranded-DNA-specific exonuclease RecJ [Burkholderia gladioli]MBU9177003.1 single-stranded-DNA-specific exonuclease RecJ [Burkholderia gladioli]MBU9188993.1 single-stranded-DNA-specific exonuclease RecJ [Burkholderia gladioli]MBU9268604.1 single-stranded-DNA-specific exonuclease RecJ [Burkholderia gladioli]MBU9319619.1 single-stranded-DNA-specific exonuclease RecJ [Burkholderia gladioli]